MVPTHPDVAALTERVQALMLEHKVPGVALGLIVDGEAHTAAFGVTNAEHPLPVTEDTLFQIGSITKTYTALALMRLVERSELDLDTPIRLHLPEFRLVDEEVAARVTLRHLLTHTGSWPGDFFEKQGDGDDALARYVARMADLEQTLPLGEVYSYNNAGFALAGRLLEVRTGQSVEAAIRDLVLQPLGLQASFFFPNEVMTRRFAVGHFELERGAEPVVARDWYVGRYAAAMGGLVTSVTDQLRYARFWLNGGVSETGERLLSPATIAQMREPYLPASPVASIGLAWHVRDVDGVQLMSHGGGTNGQIAQLTLAPEHGVAVSVLTNALNGSELVTALLGEVLERLLGVKVPAPEPLTLSPEDLEPYAGRYRGRPNGEIFEFRPANGGLILEFSPGDYSAFADRPAPPPVPPRQVALTSERTFVITEGEGKGAQGEFLRDASGAVRWVRAGRVLERIDPA
ncbi:serine hydrolase domain-containing protein [Deinococcus sonorensis]|uniref:Serine hydrolase domain-containing protein n=2 Tax=Deinococcus sonorensis TaxID=309891 RepID=A0AAU7U6N2_9DEIO